MTTALSPYELVKTQYELPFELRPLQADAVNALAPLDRTGYWAEVGTGKTAMSTVAALFKKITQGSQCVVIMPPILIKQWYRWLTQSVKGTTALMYRGTPKQRADLPLGADFILMSIQVFKNDFEYLTAMFDHRAVAVIVDEAASIKNVGSQNYQRVRDFSTGRDLMLLDGAPLSNPGDAYAYIKLKTPTVYRNQKHFNDLHVEERDFFDNVTRWGNLSFLAENLMLNSTRILKQDMMPWLDEPLYDPVEYELDEEHYRLYKKLAEEQLLILKDGGKIDATVASRLYNCLQQIICNPWHFSGDPNMRSAAHELLDSVLEQIKAHDIVNGAKLIVYANYKMTNRGLVDYLKPYGAVACFSEVSSAQQERNLDRFREDPSCRVLVGNPTSMGIGTDGLQHVCYDVLFMETPIVPRHFHQGVGRVARDGQTRVPNIRIAMASNTIQMRLQSNLLKKDSLVNQVVGGFQDLREAIYGKV